MVDESLMTVGVGTNVVHMAGSWYSMANLGLPSAARVLEQFPIPVTPPIVGMFGKSAAICGVPGGTMEASCYPLADLAQFSMWTTLGFFMIDQREKFSLGRVVKMDVDGDLAMKLGSTLDGKQPGFMMAVESNFFCPFQVLAWDGPDHKVYRMVQEDIARVLTAAKSTSRVPIDHYARMLHLNLRDILRIDGANGFPSAISIDTPSDDTKHSLVAIEYSCGYLAPPFMLNPKCVPLNERESLAVLVGMAVHPWVNNDTRMAQPARLLRKFLTEPPSTRGHDFFGLLNTAGKALLNHVCASLTADPESRENALGTWMGCALRTL